MEMLLVDGVSAVLETVRQTKPSMSSPKSSSVTVTVTVDELARAIDRMGPTESLSAETLFDSIHRVQATSSTRVALRQAILQSSMEPCKDKGLPTMPKDFVMIKPNPESVTPKRLEQRRKMLELTKAAFPNGVPLPYTIFSSTPKRD
ncbi:hypothetical protein D9615_008155 [Tricholomella constricta]|uniref:Uncharacterized protein n=1 Tax=Tricholomella constricta TaxID=117010 RepID=A0A8H5M0B0_9AGAR|nr:hypothetical protein D9615_008155 [Tricholomella constricta]